MGVAATKIEFERELQRRREMQDALQAKLDYEELTRRHNDVKSGKSRLISEDEFWESVEKLGY